MRLEKRHALITADEVFTTGSFVPVCEPSPDAAALLAIVAQESAQLLIKKPISPTERHAYLINRLREKGLYRSTVKLDHQRLGEAFIDVLSSALPYLPTALAPDGRPGEWLSALIRKRQRFIHPLFHIIIDLILAAMPDAVPPFGSGPWRCQNPCSEHFGKDVVVAIAWANDGGRQTATFRCDCGYVYTRSILLDGTQQGPRLLEYGPTLEPSLRRLVANNLSLRETGRRLGLDPKSVMTAARVLGITVPWKTRASGYRLSSGAQRRYALSDKI